MPAIRPTGSYGTDKPEMGKMANGQSLANLAKASFPKPAWRSMMPGKYERLSHQPERFGTTQIF